MVWRASGGPTVVLKRLETSLIPATPTVPRHSRDDHGKRQHQESRSGHRRPQAMIADRIVLDCATMSNYKDISSCVVILAWQRHTYSHAHSRRVQKLRCRVPQVGSGPDQA